MFLQLSIPERNGGHSPAMLAFTGATPRIALGAANTGGPLAFPKAQGLLDGGYPRHFVYRAQQALHDKDSHPVCLLVVSLNNFAMLLSGYGYETSERIVADMAMSLGNLLAPDDMLVRLQRDKLAILLSNVTEAEAKATAERLHSHIAEFGLGYPHGSLHLLASIVCLSVNGADARAEDVLDRAFIMLENLEGVVCRAYEEHCEDAAICRQEMGLASYLSRAIKDDRLRLAYQPIIDSKTGQIAHYEALLRVIGDDGTISTAGALIPIAEKMGLIHKVDVIVLEKIVKELEQSPDVQLAFNASSLTTSDAEWLERLQELVGERPDIAARMIVEITETAVHRDLARTAYFVASVQALGAQVALDDFGAGYTSFRQLKALSVDYVKIDGVFIRDLMDNADNQFFVKTLLHFTKGFGLKSVAEFVENGETAKLLMELGVDYLQGYYFGRPQNHRTWLKEDS